MESNVYVISTAWVPLVAACSRPTQIYMCEDECAYIYVEVVGEDKQSEIELLSRIGKNPKNLSVD